MKKGLVMEGKAYLKLNKAGAKRYPKLKRQGFAEYIEVNQEVVDSFDVISHARRHAFAGYYDLQNISPNGEKMFYLSVPHHASPKYNKATIHIYNTNTKNSTKIGKTSAWCWQQGSRLRWMHGSNSKLIYNDFVQGEYISRVIDVESGVVSDFAPVALYDISFVANVGISLNFQRLQTLRPGYGYSRGKDFTKDILAPVDDGVFAVDLKTKKVRLLYSLKELAGQVVSKPTDSHYINHISVSPDGKRFMFFHLWTKDSLDMWNMRLLVSDINGSNLVELEKNDIISHYCWVSDDELLVTKVSNEEPCYILYNIKQGTKTIIDDVNLIYDGHPSFLSGKKWFVSDTYPLNNCIQNLFVYNIENKKYLPILQIFSDPRFYIEKRCDLHPRLNNDNDIVNIDSTFSDGRRKVVIIKFKGGKLNEISRHV